MADEDYDTETASEIALLESQLANLKVMRSSGVLITRHGDTMVEFQKMSDLLLAIAATAKDLRRLKGTSRKPFYILQTSKGL